MRSLSLWLNKVHTVVDRASALVEAICLADACPPAGDGDDGTCENY